MFIYNIYIHINVHICLCVCSSSRVVALCFCSTSTVAHSLPASSPFVTTTTDRPTDATTACQTVGTNDRAVCSFAHALLSVSRIFCLVCLRTAHSLSFLHMAARCAAAVAEAAFFLRCFALASSWLFFYNFFLCYYYYYYNAVGIDAGCAALLVSFYV